MTENIVAETFSNLAEELTLVGDDGTVCEIEHEEEYYYDGMCRLCSHRILN